MILPQEGMKLVLEGIFESNVEKVKRGLPALNDYNLSFISVLRNARNLKESLSLAKDDLIYMISYELTGG